MFRHNCSRDWEQVVGRCGLVQITSEGLSLFDRCLLNHADNEIFGQSTTAALTKPRRPLSHSRGVFNY